MSQLKVLICLKPIALMISFFIVFNIPNALSYHITGNTIYDLEDNTSQAALTAEAAPWDLSLYNTSGVKVYNCGGNYLLGGYLVLGGSGTTGPAPYYGQYFKRTYIPPMAHNQVNIQMRVYTMDSWDGSSTDDHFEIGIDGVNIYAWRIVGWTGVYSTIDICGNSNFKDFPPFTVYMSYPHTSMTGLELKIISCADQDSSDESLGFRDVKIEFVTSPTPSSSLCAVGNAPLSSSPCPCADPNMFMYPPNSGTCFYCDPTCATCQGSGPTNCTSCDAGKYLSSGGQCLTCDGNCATCSGASTTCTSCHLGWFLVGNACFPSCDPPLISEVLYNGVTICKTPCPGQFAFWDGNCGSTCSYASNAAGAFGVYSATVNTFSICNYPCSSTSQALFWNGTCSSAGCPSPLLMTTFHGSTFCDHCGTGQHLYWNRTCMSQCNYPLSQKSWEGINFCNYPCEINHYLFTSNGSCLTNCPAGFWKNDDYRFCEACQDPLCAVCDSSFGTKCEVCREQSILSSNSVCRDCQAMSNEYVQQSDVTYEYQYKLRLWPATCNLNVDDLKRYLRPESKALFPPFDFQVVGKNQDSTGDYFIVKLNFASLIKEERKLGLTLSYLSTTLEVPRKPAKAPRSLKTTITIVNAGTLLSGLYLGSTAAFWNLISSQQFIGYFVYMNIVYPKHLETFFMIFASTNLEFLPNPLESLMNKLSDAYGSVIDQKEKYQLPHKFQALETPTLFIVNAGSTFLACLIFLALPSLLGQLQRVKKLKDIKWLQDLQSDFKWNAIIRIFLESAIPLAFAIFIQIRRVSYTNIPFALSNFCATIAIIYMLLMLYFISEALITLKYEDMKEARIQKSVGTLYEGLILKKDKPSQKFYYAMVLLRGLLLVYVDVFLDEMPLVQIVIMSLFNVLFMSYIWKRIEFDSRYLTWTTQLAEVLILIGEILIMTLCPSGLTDEFRSLIGWLIIVLFSSVLVMQFAYGIYLQIMALKSLIKKGLDFLKRQKKRKRKISPENQENNITADNSPNRTNSERPMVNFTISENSEKLEISKTFIYNHNDIQITAL